MTAGLFDDDNARWEETLVPGARVLRRFALDREHAIRNALKSIEATAPFRNFVTPGGHQMSVAMTNCGALGWVSDSRGYRYQTTDPATGEPWPAMPPLLATLASEAAMAAGFAAFEPDACLVNRYEIGARMSLHQDRNERDFTQPIVSVSLGLPAVFLFGGERRTDKTLRVPLEHGDVIVWGGPARLRYHGVLALKAGDHPFWDACRINLTFRKAG